MGLISGATGRKMEQYIGQIRQYGFNWAPRDMALCNGQPISIAQNQALFSLIGVTFGGNGTTSFDLPDLRGRAPVGTGQSTGSNYVQGQMGGVETVTLTAAETGHTHSVLASTAPASVGIPAGNILARADTPPSNDPVSAYAPPDNLTEIGQGAIGSAGGGLPHENEQPSLVISFVIALEGVYPQRS